VSSHSFFTSDPQGHKIWNKTLTFSIRFLWELHQNQTGKFRWNISATNSFVIVLFSVDNHGPCNWGWSTKRTLRATWLYSFPLANLTFHLAYREDFWSTDHAFRAKLDSHTWFQVFSTITTNLKFEQSRIHCNAKLGHPTVWTLTDQGNQVCFIELFVSVVATVALPLHGKLCWVCVWDAVQGSLCDGCYLMGMEADWRHQIMTRDGAAIMKMSVWNNGGWGGLVSLKKGTGEEFKRKRRGFLKKVEGGSACFGELQSFHCASC
jgi:hypothetical protein